MERLTFKHQEELEDFLIASTMVSLFKQGGQFAVLPAGSYDIIVVDAQGCQALSQISLNNSAAPVIDLVTITDPLCGSTNGEIEINASGGNGVIEYSIDNGATFQSGVNLFSNLADGSYTIVIQDANGCVANDAAVLNSSQGVIIDGITISDPSCRCSKWRQLVFRQAEALLHSPLV